MAALVLGAADPAAADPAAAVGAGADVGAGAGVGIGAEVVAGAAAAGADVAAPFAGVAVGLVVPPQAARKAAIALPANPAAASRRTNCRLLSRPAWKSSKTAMTRSS